MISETLASFKHLPPEVQKHLDALETYIGDTDGKDTVMWNTDPPNTCVDDGTIDASEAATAFNGIVAALTAALSDQVVVPKEPTRTMIDAAMKASAGLHEKMVKAAYPHEPVCLHVDIARMMVEYRAMIAAAPPPSSTAGEVG